MQGFGDGLRELVAVRMHGERRRQAHRDFFRERGPGHHRQWYADAENGAGDFMQETAGARLETFRRPRHAGTRLAIRRQRLQGFVERVAGRHDQQQLGVAHGLGQVGRRAKRIGQRDTRQVTRVLVSRRYRFDLGGIAPPQHGRITVPCAKRGERRSPGTGAQHGDTRFGGAHRPARAIIGQIRRCRPRPLRSNPAHPRRDGAGLRRKALRS